MPAKGAGCGSDISSADPQHGTFAADGLWGVFESNPPLKSTKKTFHKFAFYFSCFVTLLKSSWRLVEPAGVRTPERSTCHAYRAVARAVEMESDAQSSPADPDLIAVIASWATLPAAIKFGIMAMVDATKP